MSIRMRAQDGTLGRTVFWNSETVDSSGENYSGPGPLTDIVVFKVDLDGGGGGGSFMAVDTDLQSATFTATPGQMYLLDSPAKGAEALLPSAATAGNRAVVAFKLLVDTAGWGIIADGSDTIDGQSSWTIYPIGSCLFAISDGVSNWEIISNSRSMSMRQDGADIDTPSAFSVLNFVAPMTVTNNGEGQASVSISPVSQLVEFTYKPGVGSDTLGIYDDFTNLYFALVNQRDTAQTATLFTVVIDDSITFPAVIPTGAYDMTNVTWRGLVKPTGNVSVEVQEGTELTNLKKITDRLDVTFTGTTPPVTYTNTNPGLILELDRGSSIQCTGSGPFIQLQTNTFMAAVVRIDGGSLKAGTFEVIQAGPAAGTVSLQIYVGGHLYDIASTVGGLISSNTLRGNVAATVTIQATPESTVSELHANLATATQIVSTRRRAARVFQNVAGGTSLATDGYMNTFSSTAPSNVALGLAADQRGVITTIKSASTSSSTLTVLPHAGNTIDGAASYSLPSANKSVTVISDGGTNWEVIGAT